MLVRSERPDDAAAIRAVLEAAFPTPAEAELVEALREAGRLSVSLVAELDGRVVGHVAFSPVTAGEADGGVGLAPLAVDPSQQRKGVGARLVQEGLEDCRGAGFGFVVVLGDTSYYSRFGFKPASNWQLSDEFGGGPAFQALELRADACLVGPAVVRYAPEFSRFADEA